MSSRGKFLGLIFSLGIILGPVVIAGVVLFVNFPKDENIVPTRVSPTSSSAFTSPETETERLERLTREAGSLVRWIESNIDPMARCVASGKIDWGLYKLRLELFATILTESGMDAMDGRLDSYSTYEVERNIDGARETISELKSKCGIG